jgi:hypothetical protein
MKNLGYLFLLLLTSCSTVRQLERAQKFVAEHQQTVPPDTVFKYLLAANPKLKERTTRTIIKHDTVRVSKVVTVYLPAPPAPKGPNPVVDSLIRAASKQLRVKDSLAFAMRLRAALAARPKARQDTLKQRLGDLLILSWIDKAGALHTTTTNLKKKTVVVRITPAPRRAAAPKSEPAPPTGLYAFLGAHLGAIVVVLAMIFFWVLLLLAWLRRRRPCHPYAPYSNKP